MKNVKLILVALVILLTACSCSELPSLLLSGLASDLQAMLSTEGVNDGQTVYQVVTSTPATSPKNKSLLYFEDFSDDSSGWEVEDDSMSQYYYQDGEYYIEALASDYFYYIVSSESYEDGVLTIDVRNISGDTEFASSMVVWRYQDDNNFYSLTIFGDGKFSILSFKEGDYNLIKIPTASSSIKTNGETNKVAISFTGATSDIFFNDQFVFSFNDPSIMSGNVGMGVSPSAESGVKAAFDNLSVYSMDSVSSLSLTRPDLTPTPSYQAISWDGLTQFLAADHTNWHEYDLEDYNCMDFAIDLVANAKRENIKARIVGVDFYDQELGHAFVEFVTSDRGVVFVEPQGDNTYSNVEIGNYLCDDWGEYECMGIISNIEYYGECDHQQNCTLIEP